tara:strand:- start:855 stop:1880 length:1026 start_codon:yes stop_codon:yes gene_type:complete
MALILNDRVKESTTSTGTGTINLDGATGGFKSFVAGIGTTNRTYYAIVGRTTTEFEIGLGTVTDAAPDTLSRDVILSSSNSDAKVSFSAGTKDVFCTLPSSKEGLPFPSIYGSSSAPQIITVKVDNKTSNHPYPAGGSSSSSAYFLNGLESPALRFSGADTGGKYYYRFDVSDSSNGSHPFRFYLDAAKSTAYTTGVTTNGSGGSSGDYVQIAVDSETPNILYYQCSSHGYMGNHAVTVSNKINSNFSTLGDVTVGTKLKLPTNTANKILVADGTSFEEVDMSGDATIASGGALTLANSGVSAASYTASNITVDAKGRVTAASSGSAGASAGFVIAMSVAL